MVSVLCLGAVGVVGVLLLTWHFRATPTYDQYIASHPAASARFEAPITGVELGGPSGWLVGEVDPFSVTDDDPALERQEVRLELDIVRGDAVLLRLVQVVAIANERASGARVGAGARTLGLVVHPGLRASAPVYIWGADRMLEPEQRMVAFDVQLGAGSGPSHAGVYGLPVDASWSSLAPPRGAAPSGVLQGALAKLGPWAELPEEGLVHRVHAAGLTSARMDNGSGMGPSVIALQHEVSTEEYTYCVTARITATGVGITMQRDLERRNAWTWSGVVW